MGNAASTRTQFETPQSKAKRLVLPDGTLVGEQSEESAAFATAIQRMHHMFRDCDKEFVALSEAINEHGRNSAAFSAAAQQLKACQQRRTDEFGCIEARCGPAQEAYRQCIQQLQESGKGHEEQQCLPVLHAFLDCSERALKERAKG